MQLIVVDTEALAKEFIAINVDINKGNSSYIRPLDKDVHDVFDPKKNKTFRFGSVNRLLH